MSEYATTVTIPLTVIAKDRETAAEHVDQALARLLAEFNATTTPHIDPLRPIARSAR